MKRAMPAEMSMSASVSRRRLSIRRVAHCGSSEFRLLQNSYVAFAQPLSTVAGSKLRQPETLLRAFSRLYQRPELEICGATQTADVKFTLSIDAQARVGLSFQFHSVFNSKWKLTTLGKRENRNHETTRSKTTKFRGFRFVLFRVTSWFQLLLMS